LGGGGGGAKLVGDCWAIAGTESKSRDKNANRGTFMPNHNPSWESKLSLVAPPFRALCERVGNQDPKCKLSYVKTSPTLRQNRAKRWGNRLKKISRKGWASPQPQFLSREGGPTRMQTYPSSRKGREKWCTLHQESNRTLQSCSYHLPLRCFQFVLRLPPPLQTPRLCTPIL